jgi:putative aldouronate transport system permease protein
MQTARRKKLFRNQVSRPANIALNLLLLFVVVAILVPFALLLALSFTENNTLIRDGYRFIPRRWSTEAYTFLFSQTRLVLNAYRVTLIVTSAGTIGHVLLCSLFAYPLTKRSLPFRTAISFFLFFTMLFSGGLVASYIVNTRLLAFRNHLHALILPYMLSPWHVFIIRIYYETSIPSSLEESARVDGASYLTIFVRIIVPLAKPVLATIALFSALTYWNDWFQSLLYITDERLYSLQYIMLKAMRTAEALEHLIRSGASEEVIAKLEAMPTETAQFAMVVIGIGPIILVYPFLQRYFVKGITIGSIKG